MFAHPLTASWFLVKNSASKSAFTLVELLVVVAIIGLLGGLAIPAIQAATKKANTVGTLNQLGQLGKASMAYLVESGGKLPREKPVGSSDSPSWTDIRNAATTDVWYNVLPPLCGMKAAYEYSTGSNRQNFYRKGSMFYLAGAKYPASKNASPVFAVAINSKLMGDDPINPLVIQKPCRTALFIESGLPDEQSLALSGQSPYTGQPHAFASRFIARQGGKGVVVFCDGHAELLDSREVIGPSGKAWPAPQDTSGGKVIWTPDPNEDPNA